METIVQHDSPASLRDDAHGSSGWPLTCHELQAAPLRSWNGQPRGICAALMQGVGGVDRRCPLLGGRHGHVSAQCCVAEADPAQMQRGLRP
jgi:hypothetical protein